MTTPASTITLTGAQALVRLLQAEHCPAAYGIVRSEEHTSELQSL